ncbi:hypothetical protein NQ318_001347 [Aromia moschata]|uniref:PROP1-like PPR domain-containing protein n=1 Tax=Aromia moschata TaxID=1265417 RepID=A0AAV8XRR7_9CUCU|nr:hypothetical protein NQ318_001347 [Aromia moschata]
MRFHGTHSLKYGRQPVLSDEQEDRIKTSLQLCAEWGFPLKSNDVRGVVQQYLNKLGVTERRFKDNLPGLDWFKSFMKRHPELTIKLAENTKRVRAGLSYEMIQEYFQHLEQSIANTPPFNIINYDETNFADDPGFVKVVTKRGAKHTHRTIDSSKSSTTVMFAIAADGILLPPYVVYKAKHSYEGWTQGGIEGSRYNRSVSGWFDSELFEDWFKSKIYGMSKHFQVDRAMQLFEEAQQKGLVLSTNTYNNLLRVVNFLKEGYDMRWNFILNLLTDMSNAGLRPNLGTLNSILHALSTMGGGRIAKENVLKTLREFKEIGIEPSLASWYYVLITYCKEHGPTPMKEYERNTETVDD